MTAAHHDMIVGSIHNSKNYGSFEIIGYLDRNNVFIRFIDTGFENSTCATAIRSGQVKDKLMPMVYGVGYTGCGYHKTSINGESTKAYAVWIDMLRRCYDSGYQAERKQCYIGCHVVDIWHNFQTFAKWFYANLPQDGRHYHLDKDTKKPGNKVYGPDTCSIIIAEDNCAHSNARSWRFNSPSGELIDIYNLNKFCKENGLDSSSMGKVFRGKYRHHKGWTRA